MTPPNGVGSTTVQVTTGATNLDPKIQEKKFQEATRNLGQVIGQNPSLKGILRKETTTKPNGDTKETQEVVLEKKSITEDLFDLKAPPKPPVPAQSSSIFDGIKQTVSSLIIKVSGGSDKPESTPQVVTGASNQGSDKPKSGGTPQGAFASTSSSPSIIVTV